MTEDLYSRRADILLKQILYVAGMPMNEFMEEVDDSLLAFIEGQNILLMTIPSDPTQQSPGQKRFLDAYEKFLKIVGEKGGMDID